MRSYRVTMFVLHVETFEARAMFTPRSRAVKKSYVASLILCLEFCEWLNVFIVSDGATPQLQHNLCV